MGISAYALLRSHDACPGLSVIGGPVHPGRHVAMGMPVERRVRSARLVPARLDPAHPRAGRQPLHVAGQVGPRLPTVARELHVPVVGPHPDHVGVEARFADRVDGRVHLGGGVVHGDAAGLLLLLLLGIVGGQIGRDALPAVALVARSEEELRADVDGALPCGAHRDGRVPVEAQLLLVASLGLDVAGGEGAPVDPPDVAALVLGVDGVRVRRILPGPEAVAVVDVLPAAVGDAARIRRIADPGAVILQAAIDLVRVLVVDAHVVELRHGQVGRFPPPAAPVVRKPQPAVVAAHHVLGILRVDPNVVPVAVRAAAALGEAASAVLADDEVQVGLEDAVGVARVHDQAREVEGPPDHHLALVARLPGPAAVR